MTQTILFRLTQILLIFACVLREWINMLTDIGQFNKNVALAFKIISFPTLEKVGTLFNRAIDSMDVAKAVAALWIVVHFAIAVMMTIGLVILLRHIRARPIHYNEKKLTCLIGLSLGIFSYLFLIGFLAMDYFLSWMQHLSYNGDIAGYCLPMMAALIYLRMED